MAAMDLARPSMCSCVSGVVDVAGVEAGFDDDVEGVDLVGVRASAHEVLDGPTLALGECANVLSERSFSVQYRHNFNLL
jgi:hypothetical protein